MPSESDSTDDDDSRFKVESINSIDLDSDDDYNADLVEYWNSLPPVGMVGYSKWDGMEVFTLENPDIYETELKERASPSSTLSSNMSATSIVFKEGDVHPTTDIGGGIMPSTGSGSPGRTVRLATDKAAVIGDGATGSANTIVLDASADSPKKIPIPPKGEASANSFSPSPKPSG